MKETNDNTRSHERASNMGQTSIAIPKQMLIELSAIAKKEERSRNKTIEILLRKAVAEYKAHKKGIVSIALLCLAPVMMH